MIIFKTKDGLKKHLRKNKINNQSVGFVPTMGALHHGHISLIKQSLKANDITVCSIFVNPTQFNNKKDFALYPTPVEKDILLLIEAHCDILFLPTVAEMYPSGYILKNYELGEIENILEGKFRPGHYQGVCQIVAKLLENVAPDYLYLGQKDYQQCLIIDKLIKLQRYPVSIKIGHTVREKNGLAMSSRNMRLTETEKKKAAVIYETLLYFKNNLQQGDLTKLKKNAIKRLVQNHFTIDYCELADARNLSTVNSWDGQQKLVALIAATLNEVRLIDNMTIN